MAEYSNRVEADGTGYVTRIYTKDGNLQSTRHSVLVNSVDSQTGAVIDVVSKGGITPKVVTSPTTAWHDPNAKLQYFTQRVNQPNH